MFKPWLSQLKQCVEQLPKVRIQERNENATQYSVEFSYAIGKTSIDVDLLVSPDWDEPCDFYDFLRDKVKKKDRMHYSVCVAKWQQSFLRERTQIVKEYICRAKAWRNKVWGKDPKGKPKSYLMSLLVLKAYQCAQIRRRDNAQEKAERVTQALKKLVKKKKLNVCWADKPCHFYRRRDYIALLPSRPRVIDPANPANNVWETGFASGDAEQLISRIDTIDLTIPI